MKKREIKLRAIESNGFDGEVPLKPLSAVRGQHKFVKLDFYMIFFSFGLKLKLQPSITMKTFLPLG